MKLKFRIAKLEDVAENLRPLYVQDGEGFRLDVEGVGSVTQEDVDAALRARDHEKERAKTLAEQLTAAQGEVADIRQKLDAATASKNGDTAALTKSYEDRIAKMTADHQAELEKANGVVSSLTVGQMAEKLSNELFAVPSAMVHHVRNRLKMEMDNGTPKIRVLDKDGNLTALSTDDLVSEFRAIKEWTPLLKANTGSGFGHHDKGAPAKAWTRENAHEMPEADRLELLNTDRARFNELFGQK